MIKTNNYMVIIFMNITIYFPPAYTPHLTPLLKRLSKIQKIYKFFTVFEMTLKRTYALSQVIVRYPLLIFLTLGSHTIHLSYQDVPGTWITVLSVTGTLYGSQLLLGSLTQNITVNDTLLFQHYETWTMMVILSWDYLGQKFSQMIPLDQGIQ